MLDHQPGTCRSRTAFASILDSPYILPDTRAASPNSPQLLPLLLSESQTLSGKILRPRPPLVAMSVYCSTLMVSRVARKSHGKPLKRLMTFVLTLSDPDLLLPGKDSE